jgi:hypothetical protein
MPLWMQVAPGPSASRRWNAYRQFGLALAGLMANRGLDDEPSR